MKFRRGFVSNSSSTSFVVKFDTIPSSLEELMEMFKQSSKEYEFEIVLKYIWDDLQYISKNIGFENYKEYLKDNVIEYLFKYYCEVSLIHTIPSLNEYMEDNKLSIKQLQSKTLGDIAEDMLGDFEIADNCIIFDIDNNHPTFDYFISGMNKIFGKHLVLTQPL